MKNDPLLQGATVVYLHDKGRKQSAATRHKHLKVAYLFAKILRFLGYGVKQWSNVTNKHVAAVIEHWKKENLKDKTIINYLSTVRRITKFFGNSTIHSKNEKFGLHKMKYYPIRDKSLPQDAFDSAVKKLSRGEKRWDRRFKAMLLLQRGLGLRTEESAKFNPRISVLTDGRILVCNGTKGGRERIIDIVDPDGEYAIEFAKKVICGRRNLIPKTPEMTEHKWLKAYYNRMAEIGITKKDVGAGGHGNRHAYAQNRYQQMTMFPPPCKFNDNDVFVKNAEEAAGEDWVKRDKAARAIIAGIMGHGPYRNDTTSQYLGACKER